MSNLKAFIEIDVTEFHGGAEDGKSGIISFFVGH